MDRDGEMVAAALPLLLCIFVYVQCLNIQHVRDIQQVHFVEGKTDMVFLS